MSRDHEMESRYIGLFTILDEQIEGEIICNRESGVILLILTKPLGDSSVFGKSYPSIPVIIGQINNGAKVTLFHNKRVKNHVRLGQAQNIVFITDYLIWSRKEQKGTQYNELVCILKNALAWSCLTAYEQNHGGIKLKDEPETRVFTWFGAKISFSVFSNESFWIPFDSEERMIEQRVELSIASVEKKTAEELISIRDKIIAMISFAISNNVNVKEEYLVNYDDSYTVTDKHLEYHKHHLLCAKKELVISNTNVWDYNFTLDQLPGDRDINDELEKLQPVFNLYVSLFKYRDMPVEMVFLNIVQALETFHTRFYGNNKRKYIESVNARFPDNSDFAAIRKKLLPEEKNYNSELGPKNTKGRIHLTSRINDLLIGKGDSLFMEYWKGEEDYAHTIAITRNYYTHYDINKYERALKGDALKESIFVLSKLLEYHICAVLGINIQDKIRQEIHVQHTTNQLDNNHPGRR